MCEATARAELLLPLESTSPAAARRFAERSGCREHGLDTLDDALLLISELVTNSVLHGGPPIVLAVDCDGSGLHVRVRDGSPTPPTPRAAEDGAESGRGMSLVDLLSTTWGVDPVPEEEGSGKEVWFELQAVVHPGGSRCAARRRSCDRGAARPARPTGPSSTRR